MDGTRTRLLPSSGSKQVGEPGPTGSLTSPAMTEQLQRPDSHFKQPPSSPRRNRARALAIPREGMERREALYSFRAFSRRDARTADKFTQSAQTKTARRARLPQVSNELVSSRLDLCSCQSQRQIIVLLPRPLRVLRPEHRERARHAPPRVVRLDHLVDVAALGRDERAIETAPRIPACARRACPCRAPPRGR